MKGKAKGNVNPTVNNTDTDVNDSGKEKDDKAGGGDGDGGGEKKGDDDDEEKKDDDDAAATATTAAAAGVPGGGLDSLTRLIRDAGFVDVSLPPAEPTVEQSAWLHQQVCVRKKIIKSIIILFCALTVCSGFVS
jgi:hypothetical protein